MGGFLLTLGTAFGYTAGWTPYAADYTRYLPADTVPTGRAVRVWACSCHHVAGDRRRGLGHAVGAVTSLGQPDLVVHQPAAGVPGRADAAGHRGRRDRGQLDQCLLRRNGFRHAGYQAAAAHRPGDGHGVLRGRRVPGRLVGAARCRAQLRGVPADHRVLGRPVAGCGVRRPVPAPRSAVAGFLYDRAYANWNGLLSLRHRVVVSVLLFSNQQLFVGWCPARSRAR